MENISDLYLEHHGIKGQKWGIRRFQNPDGSLTNEGKKRYSVDIEGAEKKIEKANKEWNDISPDDADALRKHRNDRTYAKEDLKFEKIKDRINKKGGLTKRQEKYQQEYLKKGMTEEEAAVAAYKKDVARKALMVGAGVAIAAVGAYAGYKYGKYACDSTLKEGTILSRVAQNDNKGVHDAFYAVLDKNSRDKNRYSGMYANQLKSAGLGKNGAIFEKKIGINSDIKIASPKHAAEIMGKTLDNLDVRKNSENLKSVRDMLNENVKNDTLLGVPGRAQVYKKAIDELDNYSKTGKVGKNLYEALNIQLANVDSDITKQFYKDLKDAGYQAIKDVNDNKYSGYKTKLPVIIADAGKVSVNSVRELGRDEIDKKNTLAVLDILGTTMMSDAAKNGAAIGGIAGGVTAVGKYRKTKANDKLVKQYKEEHPNTKMSYTEIVRMYERQQAGV